MAVPVEPQTAPSKSKFIDRNCLPQKLAEYDAQNPEQVTLAPGMTPEKLTALMAAEMRERGIDPETLRYEQKYEGE